MIRLNEEDIKWLQLINEWGETPFDMRWGEFTGVEQDHTIKGRLIYAGVVIHNHRFWALLSPKGEQIVRLISKMKEMLEE